VFSLIGALYSTGDFLEMLSMGGMTGSAYQVIMQSKLVVTALMVWAIKGVRQSGLQWVLLVLLMKAMLVYNLIEAASGKDGTVPAMAYLVAVIKVALSCFSAVVADKYLKDFQEEPFCVQMVQLKLSQALLNLFLCFMEVTTRFEDWYLGVQIQGQSFFHGWSVWVLLVMISFTLKAWSTMYLCKVLDSVQKNLAEAVGVFLTYVMECSFDKWKRQFAPLQCLAVGALVLAVVAYVVASPVVDKARRYDAELACKPKAQLL